MSELDRALASVAAGQRMLISLSDIVAAGGTAENADDRVRGGRWVRVDRGVYLVAGAPWDWTTRQLATVLAAGPGAVASHLAAARLWGLPGFRQAGAEVSIPRGRRYRRPHVRTHESTDLERDCPARRDDVPVTSPDRTLLDLGRYVSDRRLAQAVEAARRLDLVTWGSLTGVLVSHARRGRPGVRRLRRVILRGAHQDEVTDSDLELMVLSLIREAGLPEPVVHHRVFDGGRFVAELDLSYPQWMIGIECDGSVHLDADVRERDLPRQNDLVLTGWTILRFSWDRVRAQPQRVVAEIRAAIDAALTAAA